MGKTGSALFLMFLALVLVFPSQSFHVQVQGEANKPVVRIDPQQTESLELNDNFTVYVVVDNAVGVEAAQVQFTYNPRVLNVTQVVEGPFLPSAGPTLVAQAYAEENLQSEPPSGRVSYSAAITTGAVASGSGVLLNVTFRVVSEGATELYLLPYEAGTSGPGTYFLNLQFVEILPDLKDGSYGSPVSLSANPGVINVGGSTTLSGRVSGSGAVNVSSVNLEYMEAGGNWSGLGSVPTNGSGFFSYQWTGNETGDYEFRVSFTLEGKTVHSLIATVTVQDITSHIDYVYDALVVLIVIIVAAVVVYYIRKKRRPEELPPLS